LNGTTTVSNVSAFTGLAIGQTVTGNGIPGGTTIAGINTTLKTITLNAAATTTAAGVPLTAAPTARLVLGNVSSLV
jgi:hypothetical protein